MLHRSITIWVLLGLGCSAAHGQLSEQLFITEVMWNSSHPGSNDQGEGGHANGDWFEILNASDMEIDMSGFRWDDDAKLSDPDGFTVFPNNFTIQPSETILIVREDNDAIEFADGFRASWDLPAELQIFGRDTFADSGPEKFSGLGSGGDEINLYDASGTLIQSVSFGEATEGFTNAWGFDGSQALTNLGLSVAGENGAYVAVSDGSNGRLLRNAGGALVRDGNGNTVVDPNSTYVPASLDVGSPGFVFGLGGTPVLTVPEVCALIATGDRTQADLDTALAASGTLRGDTDLNGTVEFADFLVLSGAFGTTVTSDGWGVGDHSCNGTVDFADFLLLSANFGKSGAGAAAAVPEPQAYGMALLAIVGLLAIRLRRRTLLTPRRER